MASLDRVLRVGRERPGRRQRPERAVRAAFTAALLLAMLPVGVALADEDAPPTESREQMLRQFDTDGDGKLSPAERDAMREARRERHQQEVLKRLDTNGDGQISDEERNAARSKRDHNREEIVKRFDKNGDGKLDDEERKAARDAWRGKALEKYDTDGDGSLDRGERSEMRRDVRKRREGNGPDH